MSDTTTVRVSKKTKTRLERISALSGLNNLSKTLDFAVEAAEDKLNKYHGNINSLLEFKGAKSDFKNTSATVDKVLTKAFAKER
ncbi:MAG: hypothetical protein ACYCPW_10675 [Nitrososphaerales archaeon]